MEKFERVKTRVLCPNCLKEQVTQVKKDEAICTRCNQEYIKKEDSNSLKFK